MRVEVDLTTGIPAFRTVGLPDASVREAKERVRAAIVNSGFVFPDGKITVNLSPADVRKTGSAFDLALAVGILAANEGIKPAIPLDGVLLLGELGLDGNLREVRGVLPIAFEAKRGGLELALVPQANAEEARLVEGLTVYPVGSLREAVDVLAGEAKPSPPPPIGDPVASRASTAANEIPDLSEVKGQFLAKRAIEISAAGGHNVLMSGPPGAGKTLLARRLPSVLPALSFDEALEVTKVHSVAGKLKTRDCLLTEPPFRAPHHTASWAAMAGGGFGPQPGEVSLAHRGVLFLDELPEFPRSSLEAMRQPLEEGFISVHRVGRTASFPARFILVAAMNPCPCGYLGAENRPCACSPGLVARYRSKVSGPLLDRIDLHVFVRSLGADEMLASSVAESSASVRKRVLRARKAQRRRFRRSRVRVNADMSHRQVVRYCGLDRAERETLRRAIRKLGLSARAFDRILKVARTISDLAGTDAIGESHLQEAIQYRMQDSPSAGVK
jgi:magnesium chelatase family protein